jgi:hypothetical protein
LVTWYEKKEDGPSAVPYKLEYDLASLMYVSTAIIYSHPNLQAPWRDEIPIIRKRQFLTEDRFTRKLNKLDE